MMKGVLTILAVSAVGLAGCNLVPGTADTPGPAPQSLTASSRRPTPPPSEPIAYVDGQVVTATALRPALMEAAGGQVLSEMVLDQMIEAALAERGLALTAELIDAERALLAETMSPDDDDEAALVIRTLRRRRGLGEVRFGSLLRRNAGLRLLVQDRVQVTPAAVEQAYRFAYGPTYRARVLVVASLQEAARLRQQLVTGEQTFADLAVRHSTDPSAVQGGLLPPISPADPGYPPIIRSTLAALDQAGESLSEVIALDGGYALLRLERKTEPEKVEFADVRDELTAQVRRRTERVLMQQQARELLAEAKVTVLDPALNTSWRQQKDALLGESR